MSSCLVRGNAVARLGSRPMAQARRRGPYQTRIAVYEGRDRADGDAGLSSYAELYGKVQRKLFADVAAGRSAVLLKREYIKEHGIPARMFKRGCGCRWTARCRRCGRRRGCGRIASDVGSTGRNGRFGKAEERGFVTGRCNLC